MTNGETINMPRKRSCSGRYAVTGCGLEGVSYEERGAAVSRAITESQKKTAPDDGTWYVSDIDGTTLVRVENTDEGTTKIITVNAGAR